MPSQEKESIAIPPSILAVKRRKEKKKEKKTPHTSGSDTSQQELTLFLSTKTEGMREGSEERLKACCFGVHGCS